MTAEHLRSDTAVPCCSAARSCIPLAPQSPCLCPQVSPYPLCILAPVPIVLKCNSYAFSSRLRFVQGVEACDAFSALARNYCVHATSKEAISDVCRHNASVAQMANRDHLAEVWMLLSLWYQSTYDACLVSCLCRRVTWLPTREVWCACFVSTAAVLVARTTCCCADT